MWEVRGRTEVPADRSFPAPSPMSAVGLLAAAQRAAVRGLTPHRAATLAHRASGVEQDPPCGANLLGPRVRTEPCLDDRGRRHRCGVAASGPARAEGAALVGSQAACDAFGNPGQRLVEAPRAHVAPRADGLGRGDLSRVGRAARRGREEHLRVDPAAGRAGAPLDRGGHESLPR